MFEVNGIIGILILFADIYAILKIAQSSKGAGVKALWIVIVLLLPLLGFIIWWFAGPKG